MPPLSRIQKEKRALIKEAALDVFSETGFRGATLDQIARKSGMSKSHLIYYFPNKEAIHSGLLADLLQVWLEPLKELTPSDEPLEAMLTYVERKAMMAQEFPRESRLFANEVIQGAPRLTEKLEGELAALVGEKAALIAGWMHAGRIRRCDPYHLIFSVWATTQHYADFRVQVDAVYPDADTKAPDTAAGLMTDSTSFLLDFYRRALEVT